MVGDNGGLAVSQIVDAVFSSRYENRYLSERDVSRLDDVGKAIVRDYLERHGAPITESEFDSIRESMDSTKKKIVTQEKANVNILEALFFQRKTIG